MVETGGHQHPPALVAVAAPPLQPPLGAAKGPIYGPSEQLLQLHYCIHYNPFWPMTETRKPSICMQPRISGNFLVKGLLLPHLLNMLLLLELKIAYLPPHATLSEMEERKWEDLDMDCLANVFGRVGLESLLLDVPFVCKSWSEASLSPLCWQHLIFPNMSPDPLCYDFFTLRLMEEYQVKGVFSITSFMKSVINHSKRSITTVALPSCCTEEALVHVAEECPGLRNLQLPYGLHRNLMLKIPNLISKWNDLEHIRCSFEIPILAQISIHCKNFDSLTVTGAYIGKDNASAIVSLFPNIRYLDLSHAYIEKENLLRVLQGCKKLLYLDISKCICLKVDDEILKLGSRISTFKYISRK